MGRSTTSPQRDATMENITLTEKVFNQIYKDLAKVMDGKKYDIRNFGDWNAQVIIPCSEFKAWNGRKTYEEWDEKMKEARHSEYFFSELFASIFTDTYVLGYTGQIERWGDRREPFVRTDACTELRKEVLALRDRINNETPYDIDIRMGIDYVYNMWFFHDERRNPHHMEDGEYFAISITNKDLKKWRDMMYDGYSRSEGCRLEHEMERRAEIAYEDMICGTRNL